MTLDEVLHDLIECLGIQDMGMIGWEQVREWPKGATEVFQKAGWIKVAVPAAMVECPGCEENCFEPVHVSPVGYQQPVQAHVACNRRDDMGKVKIPLERLQQWQITQNQIAEWLAGLLGIRGKPEKDGASGTFKLGSVMGKERLADLRLDLNDPVCLKVSGHSLSLSEIAFIQNGLPVIDRLAILAMVDLPPIPGPKSNGNAKTHDRQANSADQKAGSEIGSPAWREQTARKAANAKHDQPGGSREKQQRIREIWASGKYSSRDICAEQECAALGMSLSAARKALINTPPSKNT